MISGFLWIPLFENRVEKSSALVMEEDGKALAMLWLTTGRLRMKTGNSSQVIEADYAAGAVSGETQRHSGFMGRLLREACLQQYEQKHPFYVSASGCCGRI